jgi:hypothetical protein
MAANRRICALTAFSAQRGQFLPIAVAPAV